MEKKKQFCLWCGKPLENGYFCVGGGKTKAVSHTGEKTMTKSYCFNDFLTIHKMAYKMDILTEQDTTFLSFKPEIVEWYKSIPLRVLKEKVVS